MHGALIMHVGAIMLPCLITATRMIAPACMISGGRSGEHEVGEPVEEVAASCGPAAASGWYCTEKAGHVEAAQPLDDVVVEADVADLDPAEVGRHRRVERRVDREAVVVRGDLDLAGRAVDAPAG